MILAIEGLESDDYVKVLAAADFLSEVMAKQGVDTEEFFNEQTQIYVNDPEKKQLIFNLSQKYDTSDIEDQQEAFDTRISAALNSKIYGDSASEALALIETELNKKPAAPTIDIENTKEYLAYQDAIQAVNDKYDALISEVKETFREKGIDENTPDVYTTKTDFEDFDAPYREEITNLFNQYLVDVLGEELTLKDTNPIEYERLRTNWLEQQTDLINNFNEQSKQAALEKARRLAEPPQLKFIDIKVNAQTTTYTISSLIKRFQKFLEDGEYTDPKDSTKKVQLMPEDIQNIKDDIEALNGYLNARVSAAEPRNIAEQTIEIIQENIINKQNELENILDADGNVIGRKFKDSDVIPDRSTQVAEEVETTLLGKEPFTYFLIDEKVDADGNVTRPPLENLYDQFFNDPEVLPEDRIRLFMDEFKRRVYRKDKGGWKQFRFQEKIDAVENSLKTVGTYEDLKATVKKYAFKESSDAGDYVDTLIRIFLTPNAATRSKFSEFTYDSEVEMKGRMIKVSDVMSRKVYDKLFAPVTPTNPGGIVTKFRLGVVDGSYMILSENVKVFDRNLRDGKGVTGELDLLLVREDGSIAIVDIKTSSQQTWNDWGKKSYKDKQTYFRAQQSIYGYTVYNNTGLTPELKLMPFTVTLSDTKVGYIEDIELASIVPEGQDTVDLQYLPEIENHGIQKITPNIQAPIKTTTTNVSNIDFSINVSGFGSGTQTVGIRVLDSNGKVTREFNIFKKGNIVVIEPIQGSVVKTLDLSETEKENLLKEFISPETLDLIYQHRESPYDNGIKKSLETALKNEVKTFKEQAALKGTVSTEGLPESDPKMNKLKDNLNKAVIYNGRPGKLVRMPDGNFGVEVTINNDITTLQLTLDALLANLDIEKQYGSEESIAELERDIKRLSDAIKSNEGITEIFPLQKDSRNVNDGEITLDKTGLQLVVPIESVGQLSTIKGEVINAAFSNKEESIASINGVRYDVLRDNTGNITALSYMSNAQQISDLDKQVSEINNKINRLRNNQSIQEEDRTLSWDYRQDSIIARISELQNEVKGLINKRSSLVESNKKIYLYGENANNYIFALNRLPNNFQRLTKEATKANETQDLKSIANLSLSSAIADKITEILSEQYPDALDKLIEGDTKSVNSKDLLNIQLWVEDAVEKLNQLGYTVINRGDIVDDIANQIDALNELSNNLALIKLTKDGKIKNYKQVAEVFRGPELQNRPSVSQNERTTPRPTEGVSRPATREEVKDIVKQAREENLGDVFGQPVELEETSTLSEAMLEDIAYIENVAKLSNIESVYQKAFLDAQKRGENATELTKSYKKRLQELKTVNVVSNVEIGEYLISKNPIFTDVSNEIVQVTDIFDNTDEENAYLKGAKSTVKLKNIKTGEVREFTEEELSENFEKTTMEATQPEPEVELTPIDMEDSKESKDTIDDLIKNGQDAIAESKQKAKTSDRAARWNKLGENSKLC
jgi:dsDNA-binding SOS-regulon protein